MEDYKKLENENKLLRKRLAIFATESAVHIRNETSTDNANGRRNVDRYPEYQDRVTPRELDRMESENARLKEKLKKAANFINRWDEDREQQELYQ
jgi:hypothetical protein